MLMSFLDLEKAFDSISRQLLLDKLKKLGCTENTLKWFTSFLNNRQHITTIGSHNSNDYCFVKEYSII